MADPTYGGKLTYVNGRLRLEVRVDFPTPYLPQGVVTLEKVRYQVHKVAARSITALQSPDGLMTLVPTAATFPKDTDLIIIEGYDGWQRSPNGHPQYFLHAGTASTSRTSIKLGTFSLRFSVDNPTWSAANLDLCHRPGVDHDTPLGSPRPVVAIPNAVEVTNLDTLGYYGLMPK